MSDTKFDGRCFGFVGIRRVLAAELYARREGATQEEVNEYMKNKTPQKGFYNLLDQATKWGHKVATWYDSTRGKVFKLIYNESHSAKRAIDPPVNWRELNSCDAPAGAIVDRYIRNHR